MKIITSLCLVLVFLSGCADVPNEQMTEEHSGKRIALTYDDAPRGTGPVYSGSERTDALISQLKKADTGPVAFFVTTKGFDNPDGRNRIAAYDRAGHLIANHSHTHMWASRTSVEKYSADIAQAEAKLEGFTNRRSWFRFPYLDEGGMGEENKDLTKRDSLRETLTHLGLFNGYVTVDTYDWHLNDLWRQAVKNGEFVDRRGLAKIYTEMVLDAANHYDGLSQEILGRRPAQVLLLHENDLAANFTESLVDVLRADGWDIIHPDKAYEDPIADFLPQTRFSGMGRISAIAADQGLKGKEVFDHWSANRNAIEIRVQNANIFIRSGKDDSEAVNNAEQ